MNVQIFLSGYAVLIITTIMGAWRFKNLDHATRFVVILLALTSLVEISAFIAVKTEKYIVKNILYHIFSIVQAILIASYYIRNIKPERWRVLNRINICVWITLGTLNIIFLQHFNNLNSNFLVTECLAIITLSLYQIYWLLAKRNVNNIFEYAHFWIAIINLILWSSTFFFWAFIAILYKRNWKHLGLIISIQTSINLLTYLGIALVLFFYPKMKKLENC